MHTTPAGSRQRASDRDAEFRQFAETVQPRLNRVAWVLTLDQDDADDLLQETFARVYANWRKIALHDGDPYHYARRVLVNLRTDRWRARRNRELAEASWSHAARPEQRDVAADVVAHTSLAAILATLPVRDRHVLALRYLLDLSVAETAETLNVSQGAVKMATTRALARLRDQEHGVPR